jgi:hypothetical protein
MQTDNVGCRGFESHIACWTRLAQWVEHPPFRRLYKLINRFALLAESSVASPDATPGIAALQFGETEAADPLSLPGR